VTQVGSPATDSGRDEGGGLLGGIAAALLAVGGPMLNPSATLLPPMDQNKPVSASRKLAQDSRTGPRDGNHADVVNS
jgi:hypothetical protein